MKRALLTVLIFLLLPFVVLAQKDDTPPNNEEPVITDSEEPVGNTFIDEPDEFETDDSGKLLDPFYVEIEVGPQSPWNNNVPLIVTIRSKIDASRTEVTWDHGFGVVVDESKYKNYFPLAKDAETVVKGYLKPNKAGTYTVTVNVTDWGYGRNYSSTDTVRLEINEDLLVTPAHSGRSIQVLLRYIILLVVFIVLLFLAVIFGKKFMQWLKIWLQPPPT